MIICSLMQVRYTAIYKPTDTKLERLLTGYHASSCKGEVIQKKKQWHYKDAASRLLVDILHYIEFTREERLPKFMASTDRLAHWVNGYPRFAGQIELIPETAIFRRFGGLNAQNLLYLQAELAALEEQLHQQQIQDSRSGHPGKSNYAFSWYRLSTSEDDNDQRQLRLVYRIRETLKLYNEALIQQSQILAYPEPDQWDLRVVQNSLQHMGIHLHGPDGTIWGSVSKPTSYAPDLVTLCPRRKEDPFSGWLVEKAIRKFACCFIFKKPSRKQGTIGYNDSSVLKITYWITSILASLIPIASIVVLYCVHQTAARLGIIGVFNVLISVCLIAFTNAKRAEVFAITAAFAAVQVVFVSSDKTSAT